MQEEVIAPTCERADDLIAFLYGEFKDAQARNFEQHLQECASCKSDLASFKQIRNSIDSWRQESLGVLTATVEGGAAQRLSDSIAVRPSARAAIREFFNLSPLWMKGAMAFGSLLLCIMAVLGIAQLRETQRTPLLVNQRLYTEEDLNARVAQIRAELETGAQRNPDSKIVVAPINQPEKRQTVKLASQSSTEFAQREFRARRPLTRTERAQLAADLRLISPKDETDLDLLGDRLNRQD